MKGAWSFPKQVFVVLLLSIVATAYPLVRFASDRFIAAAALGAALTTVNVLVGYAAIEYSIGKSAATFLKFVLGGMGVRMLLMALVIGLAIKMFDVDVVGLVSSIGVFYVIFLALEIFFIQKRVGSRQHS